MTHTIGDIRDMIDGLPDDMPVEFRAAVGVDQSNMQFNTTYFHDENNNWIAKPEPNTTLTFHFI